MINPINNQTTPCHTVRVGQIQEKKNTVSESSEQEMASMKMERSVSDRDSVTIGTSRLQSTLLKESNCVLTHTTEYGHKISAYRTENETLFDIAVENPDHTIENYSVDIDKLRIGRYRLISYVDYIAVGAWVKSGIESGNITGHQCEVMDKEYVLDYDNNPSFVFDFNEIQPTTPNLTNKAQYWDQLANIEHDSIWNGDVKKYLSLSQMTDAVFGREWMAKNGTYPNIDASENSKVLVNASAYAGANKFGPSGVLDLYRAVGNTPSKPKEWGGETIYEVRWAPNSTRENPAIRFHYGQCPRWSEDFTKDNCVDIEVTSVDPRNASFLEMCALYTYRDYLHMYDGDCVTDFYNFTHIFGKNMTSDDITQKKNWYDEIEKMGQKTLDDFIEEDKALGYYEDAETAKLSYSGLMDEWTNTLLHFEEVMNKDIPKLSEYGSIKYQFDSRGDSKTNLNELFIETANLRLKGLEQTLIEVFQKKKEDKKLFQYDTMELFQDAETEKMFLLGNNEKGEFQYTEFNDENLDVLNRFFRVNYLKPASMPDTLRYKLNLISEDEMQERIKKIL